MYKTIIDERLKQYHLQSQEAEEDALKEILQEIALYALSTTASMSSPWPTSPTMAITS